jgi:predicted transcriptional regulator of viral defense system
VNCFYPVDDNAIISYNVYALLSEEKGMSILTTAHQVFRAKGGVLRTGEALAAGIHPRTLYAMRDAGEIEMLARGVYRLAGMGPMGNPDLATVGKRVPHGVICLISALAFHELTTQVPHEVHLAISRTARRPRAAYPPLRVYRFSKSALEAGIETHNIDGVAVRIYNPEKTLADCFKYRSKIGMEVVLEALRAYRRRHRGFGRVLEYAKVCRVERGMRPYLEALG